MPKGRGIRGVNVMKVKKEPLISPCLRKNITAIGRPGRMKSRSLNNLKGANANANAQLPARQFSRN